MICSFNLSKQAIQKVSPKKMRMATKIRFTDYFPNIKIGPYANQLNL
jgi:hypothetical protein